MAGKDEAVTYKAAFFGLLGLLLAIVGAAVAVESRFARTIQRDEFADFREREFRPFATATIADLADIKARLMALERQRAVMQQTFGGDGGDAVVVIAPEGVLRDMLRESLKREWENEVDGRLRTAVD